MLQSDFVFQYLFLYSVHTVLQLLSVIVPVPSWVCPVYVLHQYLLELCWCPVSLYRGWRKSAYILPHVLPRDRQCDHSIFFVYFSRLLSARFRYAISPLRSMFTILSLSTVAPISSHLSNRFFNLFISLFMWFTLLLNSKLSPFVWSSFSFNTDSIAPFIDSKRWSIALNTVFSTINVSFSSELVIQSVFPLSFLVTHGSGKGKNNFVNFALNLIDQTNPWIFWFYGYINWCRFISWLFCCHFCVYNIFPMITNGSTEI